MATENVINQPRIDRAFVNASGALTEYGYNVIARLIERVGGSVGDIIDGRALATLSLAPLPVDPAGEIDALRQAFELTPPVLILTAEAEFARDAQIEELRALVARQQEQINALQIGVQA